MGRKLESTNTYKRITQGTEGSLCQTVDTIFIVGKLMVVQYVDRYLSKYLLTYLIRVQSRKWALLRLLDIKVKSSVLADDYFRFLFRYLRGQAYKQGLTGMELTRRGRERGHPIDQRIGHKSSYLSKADIWPHISTVSPFLVCYIMTRVTCRL